MHKSRKLLTAAAISLVLASTASHGLTLGDIEMRSALNQTMDARISLQPATPNEIDGIRVNLASQEDFARAGLARTAALNDLTFSVDRSIPGQPVIRVSSARPVVEPFLNFLLEVDWPQGRLVREYTVLLDPPVFLSPEQSQRATISDNTAVRASDTSGVPVPIERVETASVDLTGGSEFSFDESSVQIIGDGGEVDDSAVFGGAAVGVDQGTIISDQTFTEADVTSEVTFDSGTFTEGEVVVLDENAPAFQTPGVVDASSDIGVSDDLQVEVISGSTELGGEVVTLTDTDNFSSTGSTFTTAQVSGESFDGFDVQILGDTQEVGDDVGSVITAGDSSFATNTTSIGGEEVVVRNGDTLTQIARANQVDGVSTQQMMIALLEANQQAFINGNINLLRAGAILRIPDSGSLSSVSQAQALVEVAEQEQLWREYRDSLRGTSSTRVAAAPTPSTTEAEVSPEVDTDSAADTEVVPQGEDSVSQSAQDILDEARRELDQARDELRLVGDSDASDTASSTSADESDQPETENLGEINRELQLAREELAATQLKTEELTSRDEALSGTAERIDTLVELRQNEVARLEQQLADARTSASESAESVTAEVEDNAGGLPEVDLFDESAGLDSDATGTAEQQAEDATRVVQPVADAQTESQTASSAPWYQQLLNNKLLIAAGVGLLALLGLLATMFKRRGGRKGDQFDAFDEDDVEFLDEFGNETNSPAAYAPETDGDISVDDDPDATRDESNNVAAAGVAGAAGVAAVAAGAGSAADEASDATLDEGIDSSMLDDDETVGHADQTGGDSGSGDEVLSEADVYMAYGLHGQAEDLLKKASAENPDAPVYQEKLLEAFHKQNNASSFDEAAAGYSQKFGTATPAWAGIAAMGHELNPTNDLFKGASSEVASMGGGSMSAASVENQDFTAADDNDSVASSVRDFSESDVAAGGADESGLFDQTLDPGAAFDETDLEATGDFTRYTEELNQSADAGDSLLDSAGDLAGSAGDAVSDTASGVADASKAALGGAAAGAAGLAAGVAGAVGLGNKDADAASADSGSGESIDFDTSIQSTELDLDAPSAGSVESLDIPTAADDLTMDLDQISGDLNAPDALPELDDGLEINDLTAADLTADASLSIGDTDEMDTMMDLAKAYIDMGDNDSASSALDEIVKSGNPEQRSEAETLLRKIS